jgi:hypothetical protein
VISPFAVAARPIKLPFQTHTELEDAFELRTTLCASSRILKATALNEHRIDIAGAAGFELGELN